MELALLADMAESTGPVNKLIFNCNNKPVVDAINNKHSKSHKFMALTRTLLTLEHKFYFIRDFMFIVPIMLLESLRV